MKEKLESSVPSEKISTEKMKEIIQDVIDDKFEAFDARTMANYDAEFTGDEPYFIN